MSALGSILVLAVAAALGGAPSSVSAGVSEPTSLPVVSSVGSATAPVLAGAPDTAGVGGDGAPIPDVLLLGLVAVASVAVVGMLVLAASRRRHSAGATSGSAGSAMDEARVRRRARSGRALPADDPVVAALGVDDEIAARRAIRRAARTIEDDERNGGNRGAGPGGR